MEMVNVDGGALQAWSKGEGEPVLLIHGAVVSDAFGALLDQPGLDGYRFIGYRRRGYEGSAPVAEATIEAYARDAIAVMDHFGVDRAHVVAHSFGGRIGMELGRQAPERVASLALLEGGGASDLAVPSAGAFLAGAGGAGAALQEGDMAGATEKLLVAIAGDGARASLDRVLDDGWFDQATADIVTVFKNDLSSTWSLTLADIPAIATPSMVMVGDQTIDFFRETAEAVAAALPDSETVIAPGADHMLQMMRPDVVAPLLADWLSRHPMA